MEIVKDNENEIYQASAEKSIGIEIDVIDLLLTLWDNAVSIVLGACFLGLLAYLYVTLAVVPTYTASATMYVINAQNYEASLTYADIQSSTQLINDSRQLILSDKVIDQTIENLGLEGITASQIRGSLSVTIQEDTRFLKITTTNTDPYRAADISNMICQVASEEIQTTMNLEKVSIVDVAKVPASPSAPNVRRYVLGGGLLGAVLMILFVMVRYMLDDTLKTTEDVEKYLELSLLGSIPELESLSETKKSKKKKNKKHKR